MKLIKPYYEILTDIHKDQIFKTIEQYGRICYKSENRITDDSSTNFVGMLLNRNHLGPLEHVLLTIKFVIPRGISHELVRHRIASYLQESTRYVNYKNSHITYIIPPWINISEGEYTDSSNMPKYLSLIDKEWFNYLLSNEKEYNIFIESGWTPQQARGVLPLDLKTEVVTTMNLREWRYMLELRTSKAAHPQMVEIMTPLTKELQTKIPLIFDNIKLSNK
jgi:thymidylate synthase (FAD)